MDGLGMGMMILAGLTIVVCNIWILILAFQKHIGWGLASFLVPFVGFIFVVMNWNKAGKPFIIYLVSVVIAAAGYGMSPTMQKQMADSTAESSSQ